MSSPVTSYNPAEASHLLSAVDEIKGTKVFSPAGDDLGHIDDVMIDATSGKVVYGVLQFGGFLGIGSDYHPIPFGKLTYDQARHGYTTNLTKEELEGAPRYSDDWRTNREWQQQSYDYFGVAPYWP
ncbi:PRC-barrel domain-containing protein [Ketogulonicigenium vulgare]|uniref:PRC-barrel domain protein n=1 Tax=Ketogulonicigenium vulgare (strain WSH-001) TaxID=759362 RepID=F9YAW6_KETVW|nr:PRC-barrel domain-containing protein [Ketogulonicigenium vulgare]ADO43992.1 PRC-barrel domain-containing protein [Ketogulonicigenium vulgare Y25]AEM42518.1 PRC-barrel domain protein [Ketogulonicigenium vulgare WSH-001]ALJ82557.1 photosystem reaction center subunit H [Ketogulonicigenium vulgare]AOZ53223.1 PRC-barrel domain-containing protein [Ketogulonicigenium vulgare]